MRRDFAGTYTVVPDYAGYVYFLLTKGVSDRGPGTKIVGYPFKQFVIADRLPFAQLSAAYSMIYQVNDTSNRFFCFFPVTTVDCCF